MGKYDDLIPRGGQTGKPQSKVLGVGGSPRRGGNSDVLLKHVLKGVAERDITATGIHLRDFQYQGCVGCEQCRRDKICTGLRDGLSLVYPAIVDSRGLILVSPTHNYNVTAWMKAFIDRLYCFYDFDNHRPRGWSSRLAGQGRKALWWRFASRKARPIWGLRSRPCGCRLKRWGMRLWRSCPRLAFLTGGR